MFTDEQNERMKHQIAQPERSIKEAEQALRTIDLAKGAQVENNAGGSGLTSTDYDTKSAAAGSFSNWDLGIKGFI